MIVLVLMQMVFMIVMETVTMILMVIRFVMKKIFVQATLKMMQMEMVFVKVMK